MAKDSRADRALFGYLEVKAKVMLVLVVIVAVLLVVTLIAGPIRT
jgi:hypothetical protein